MREKINKLAKGNIDDVKPLIKIIPERLDFVTQKGELIKADVLLKSENHIPMKALAYSSDPRAKVLTPSFGGESAVLKLQFNYAVYDTTGSFAGYIDLVTNAGELRLEYTINIRTDKNGEFLSELESVDDFEKIVRADESAALKLFQYKNFTDAAFMRDARTAMLYGAFSGRPDKALAMRQFVLAVKKYVNGEAASSDAFEKANEHETANTSNGTNHADSADSRDTAITSAETANPKAEQTFDIPTAFDLYDTSGIRHHSLRYYIAGYCRSRLNYETGDCTDTGLLRQMSDILDAASEYETEQPFITLLKAENRLLAGDTAQASEILGSVKERIQNNRQRYLDEYFLLEYINCRINGDSSRRASYIRLLYKFITEEKKNHLFAYLVRTDDTLKKDSAAFHNLMHRLYDAGYRSPFLYLEYVRFLNEHPDYLHDPTELDINALFFGCRHNLLSERLISELTDRASLLKLSSILYYPIFTSLYKKTQSPRLLQAICSTLIRADRRDTACHHWYAAGVDAKAQINGLYEYYLYTMPRGEDTIADDVLAHFSDQDNLDAATRARLYAYVVRHKDTQSLIYRVYEPKIRTFAQASIRERRMSGDLIVIYRQLLASDAEPEDCCEHLPEILSTCRYTAEDAAARSMVALYPQLRHEQVFSADESRSAYIPVISQDMIVLVQDAYGNRYCDRELTCEKLFDEKRLMDICRFRCPDDMIVQLITVDELVKKSDLQEDEIHILEHAAEALPLSEQYKLSIDRRLIDFYDSERAAEFRSGYMQAISKAQLDRAYRCRLTGAQIRAGLYQEAFAGICMDGFDDVDSNLLREMCTRLILGGSIGHQEHLLQVAYETLRRGCFDKIALDYLCEHYNGASADMYRVLERAIEDGIDTGDLEERLLAQLIFVDDIQMIDRVFDWYAQRKRVSEQIVKAYFTVRTYRYFMYDEPTKESVFEYIESVIAGLADPTALPVIHQLALTRHYASQEQCTKEQIEIAQVLIRGLFLRGYAFPYFKSFGRYFELPRELKDDVMTAYTARGAGKPYVMTRLRPAEAQMHLDSLKRMYKSVYVLDKIIFDDEQLDYEIYETEGGIDTVKAQGTLTPDTAAADTERHRFSRLNEMIGNFRDGDEIALRSNMDEYMVESRIVAKLFGKGK